MQRAGDLHREGRLADAAREYEAIRAADPKHFLATYNLGIIAVQAGRLEDGERLIGEAARLEPKVLQAQLVHGKLLGELNRIDEALARYDVVLARDPGNVGALNDRATTLFKRDRYGEALVDLDRLLAIDPQHIFALYNRATALTALKRADEAIASLDRAFALKPDFVEALLFKGNLLRDQGRMLEAADAFATAFTVNPQRPDCLNNHGSVMLELGRHAEALASFDRALAVQPKHLEVMVNRGRTLGKLGRGEEDLASYGQALALNPDFVPALLSRGIAYFARRRYGESLADLDKAATLEPGNEKILHARANTLTSMGRREDALKDLDGSIALKPDADTLNNKGLILRLSSRFEEAADTFARMLKIAPGYPYAEGNLLSARLHCCDWRGLDDAIAHLDAGVKAGRPVANPFILLQVSNDPEALLACARQFVADKYKIPAKAWAPGARQTEKLRIAYLSADLQTHATAYLMAGFFEGHDRGAFETIAVSLARDDGTPMRRRLAAAFDRFIDASTMTDEDVAAMLRAMPVDIAVDLKGFTNDARPAIFLQRVAPLQVNYLGYPCTWGSPCMDYILADATIIPEGQERFYSEQIARLPDSYQPNDRKRVVARAPMRAEAGLPPAGIVFACFNGNYKILPAMFDIWMQLLQRVDGAVLWLLETNSAAARNLKREAVARGVAPERLIFAPFAQPEEHLARQPLADLFLDTLPVNAHTTTSDALWAGLPVLTCTGHTFAARVAASLLNAAGLPELVTTTPAEYEQRALELATTPGALPRLRAKLAGQRLTCPLFDTERTCRQVEAAYRTMWQRQVRGEPPHHFTVPR